jgi:hypothetical protein
MSNDHTSIVAWQTFLTRYAAGEFNDESTPPIPPIPPNLVRPHDPNYAPAPWAYANAPLYSASTGITLEDARVIRQYYIENHYLPPPRSPLESQRHATITQYDLYSARQHTNIQAATEVVAAFFPGTVCTFSLFHDHVQKHFCLAGNQSLIQKFNLTPGLRIPAEDSLCGHAILNHSSIFFVKDLKKDWRYLNNPFVFAGFKSFIGSSVSLPINPLQGEREIGVGTLNVCFIDESIDVLTEVQRNVIRHVTTMLETQLRATWEGDQRTRDGRARLALSELIDTALVDVQQEEGHDVAARALDSLCQVMPELDSIVLVSTGGIEVVSHERALLISPASFLSA